MEISIQNTNNKTILTFSGNLNIQNAEKALEALKSSFEHYNTINIQFNAVETIDYSFMQLVYAAMITAKNHQKNFTIIGEPPPAFFNVIQLTGIEKEIMPIIKRQAV